MGFILIAAVLIVGMIIYCKSGITRKVPFLIDGVIIAVAIIGAFLSLFLGTVGICTGEAEYKLIETNELTGIKQGEVYVFLDEEGRGYYVNEDRMSVASKNEVTFEVYCVSDIGDYEKIYVEKYDIDYKMNFWTFNILNGSEYKLYIPQSMASE